MLNPAYNENILNNSVKDKIKFEKEIKVTIEKMNPFYVQIISLISVFFLR
jgi:hypothetical protein